MAILSGNRPAPESARTRTKGGERLPAFLFLACLFSATGDRTSLDLLPCPVAVARDHVILQAVVLFILHLQRFAFVVYQLHAYLAVRPVLLRVGRPVADHVLVANRGVDIAEDFGHLTFKAREVGLPARHAGESSQLIVRLQIVNLMGPEHSAAGIPRQARGLARTYRIDRDVRSGLDLLHDL